MNQKIVHNKDIQLFTEYVGDLKNPLVILVMGATAQGVMWDQGFCEEISKKGYCVVRYDHRDTGKSSRVDYERNKYTLTDLTEDLISIILEYGNGRKVHLVGASMGSFLAQNVCIIRPDVVKTLTCVMSSPKHTVFVDGFVGNDTDHHPLPPSHPDILRFYQEILSISSKDIDEDLLLHKEIWKKISNHEHSDQIIDTRVFEGKILKRLKNNKYIHNHSLALANSEDLFDKLYMINIPTLVIHGKDDYVLPLEHGRMLSHMIKHSRLIEYEQMGHCLPKKLAFKIALDLLKHFVDNA